MNWETMHRLQLFQELITCGHNIYFWTYNSDLELTHCNCPHETVLSLIFTLEYKKDGTFSCFHTEHSPVLIHTPLGLSWIVDSEKDSNNPNPFIHAIGPVFFNDISTKAIEDALNRHNLSIPAKRTFLATLKQLPIISYAHFLEYGQMLHYCISGDKIPYSQIRFSGSSQETFLKPDSSESEQHGTWAAEQEILKMIETGNLDYRKHQDRLGLSGNIGKMSNGDTMRQFKNQVIAFIVLASRAAIRGGLSPETAYTLSDLYIQNVEACSSLKEIATVSFSMHEDFVQRVHDCKLQNGVSSQIQQCCDYIQFHITEKINLEELSAKIGYSQNYLCQKFKTERGINIRDYINQEKIKYAQDLLMSTHYSVQEISELLHFSSPSYFCELFRKINGVSPNQFRANKTKP